MGKKRKAKKIKTTYTKKLAKTKKEYQLVWL